MARIYRQTSRIEIKITDEIKIKIKPLSSFEKQEISDILQEASSKSQELKLKIVDLEKKFEKEEIKKEEFELLKSNLVKEQRSTMEMFANATYMSVKYGLKSITGVIDDETDKDFCLTFIDGDEKQGLTDECLNDLKELGTGSDKLMAVCMEFFSGVPEKFKTEGVEFVDKKKVTTESQS